MAKQKTETQCNQLKRKLKMFKDFAKTDLRIRNHTLRDHIKIVKDTVKEKETSFNKQCKK